MVKTYPVLLLLSLLAAPAAPAQEPGAAPERSRAVGRREFTPFEAILRHREELRLSAEQVARLEAVARGLEQRNAPLRQRLAQKHDEYVAQRRAQVRRLSPEQRRDTLRRLREERRRGERIPRAMRPLVEEMRANTRRAMEEARQVLTPDQKRRARELVRERRAEARERARARPGGRLPGQDDGA